MTRLYNNLKKGPICSGRSQAWALFIGESNMVFIQKF